MITASSPAIHRKMYGTCGKDMTSKSVETTMKHTAAAAAASATGASCRSRDRIGLRATNTTAAPIDR